ncbi:thiol-disulfide oxidoreductase DCC family protein [Asticcacaulis sp.]|uniref:thiol-disulfide oxidoreductase DCC family protein n=1 Tax=Asticcacaulis sp. TaxID=1872648 RepID=UPI002628C857|nr:DUF393 domain-containing protein [Asticcacaulis sp.]
MTHTPDESETPDPEIAACGTVCREGLTVYFDGSCALCSTEIRYYSVRAGDALRFVDVADSAVTPEPDLPREAALNRLHVRQPDGTLVSGAQAFIAIWSQVPGWRWLARLARLPGVAWWLERAYRAFLPVRPVLSRLARALGARPMRKP